MKKTLAIILALTMILCLALASCSKNNNADNNTDTEKENIVETQDKFDSLEAYNAYLEDLLVKIQPKDALDEEILATIGGLPITATAVKYTYEVVEEPYKETLTAEEINDEVVNFHKGNAALIKYAFDKRIELSEQDENAIKANITSMELQLGEDYEKAFAESPFTKFFYYFQTGVIQSVYTNLYNTLIEDHESEMSKTALEETLTHFEENEYVRAKHILVQFPAGEGENGAVTDEQKQATLEKANEVLDKVNAMTDISEFDALIKEYNEDPGMESNPGGYYFKKGEMVAPFEEAAYALEEGKTSGLVETDFGYHILLKLPLEDDAIYDSQVFSEKFSDLLYDDIMSKFESNEIEYGENYETRKADFAAEYQAKLSEAEAENETASAAEIEAENTAEAAE